MKFQSASKNAIRHVALGTVALLALQLITMYLLTFVGVGTFDYRVPLSAVCGTAIAIGNFALLCLTIQKASVMEDKRKMKARFQLSYNARLIAQGAWVVVAFKVPCFQAVAAALPLLYPSAVLVYLNKSKTLVTPSDRKNPPAEEETEERLDSFEV